MEEYDAVVIGGGPGGYVAAIRLGQLGLKTALVERELIGGECLNWGCIPSKILIENVKQFHRLSKLGHLKGGALDWGHLQESKRRLVSKIRDGVEYLLRGNNVKIIHGTASLSSDNRVRITEKGGATREIRGKSMVIATGAAQSSLPNLPYDGKRVLTPREVLDLERVPGSLLVVGGGAIGLELGTVYAKMGCRLTIVEIMDQLLPGLDRDVSKMVERSLKELGAKIYLSSKVASSRQDGDGVKVTIETPNESVEEAAEYVLVAVGKRSSLKGLGVEDLGITLDERGFIRVDEHCMTNVEDVYAVGDVTGPPFLAHKASRQGVVAAENIAGRRRKYDPASVPLAIFTDPEVASVGLTREEVEKMGYKARVTRISFTALGRAVAEEAEGFIRVISDQATGRVLGVQIVGSMATELIGEASLAVKNGLTVEQLAETIHPHPTFSEIFSEAAEAAIFKPIHMLVK